MMNKIKPDAFRDFRMLSSLTFSPDSGKPAYVLTGSDREKKEYVGRLRRPEEITGWFDKCAK